MANEEQTPDAEELKSFRDWQAKKAGRKVKSQGKREAIKALIKAHQAEYDKLLVQHGVKK